ncbi:MAG: DUF4388 domain-containing protein [Blastocatellia bacterium]
MSRYALKNQTSLPDFAGLCFDMWQSACLRVEYPSVQGMFYFAAGELVDARLGDLQGEEACRAALAQTPTGWRIDLDITIPPRSVSAALDTLLAAVETVLPEQNAGEPRFMVASARPENVAGIASQTINLRDEDVFRHAPEPGGGAGFRQTLRGEGGFTSPSITDQGRNMPVTANQTMRAPGAIGHDRMDNTPPAGGRDSLAEGFIARSGMIIDEDGVVVLEIGQPEQEIAQTAFMISGLEALVSAQFNPGPCEGALLEQNGSPVLVTQNHNLTCAFRPMPRIPVNRAFNEIRRALSACAEDNGGME